MTATQSPAPHVADRPRSDPRARRAREQPQGRQRRAPEAPADGVHRRVRLGQELAGVRHDRRRSQRLINETYSAFVQGFMPTHGAARGRRPRRPDDRDPRRPGADGLEPTLHRRHRHRRQRDAAHPLQPARAAAHRLAQRLLVQRPIGAGHRRDHDRAWRRQDEDGAGDIHPTRRHVSALRGHGLGQRLRPVRVVRRQPVAQRGRAHRPRLQHGRLVRPHLPRLRLLRSGQADPQVHQAGAARPPVQGADQDQGRGDQPDVRRPDPADPEVVPVQGRRRDAAAHPGVRGACGHVHDVSRVRRHPAQQGGQVVEDQGQEHRRRLLDADQRPRRLGPRAGRAVGGPVARRAATPHRRLLRDRTRLPLARPAVRHAVRW